VTQKNRSVPLSFAPVKDTIASLAGMPGVPTNVNDAPPLVDTTIPGRVPT